MKKLSILLGITVSLFSFAGVASAQVVVSGEFGIYDTLPAVQDAGAVYVPNWNTFTPANDNNDSDSQTDKLLSGVNLNGYNIGTATDVSTGIGASLAYDAQFESDDSNTDTGNEILLRSSFFTRRTPTQPQGNAPGYDLPLPLGGLSLSLTGLSLTDTYDLYVYVTSPVWANGSSATITDGAQSFNITTDNALTGLQQITGVNATGNYVEFTGITDLGTAFVTIPGGNTAGVSGFQLVDETPVPEPSTWAMMLAGLGALLVYNRRRKLAIDRKA